jgi:hypothetical protein
VAARSAGDPRGKPEIAPVEREEGHPMTDLLSRPARRTGASAGPTSAVATARPLTTSALLAGAGAAVVTLVLCMAVAITGWFLADAGAHGDTRDALRVGADAWLVGHGSGLTFSGMPLGMVPLGLTAVLFLTAFRAGRWAGHSAADGATDMEADRSVLAATVTYLLAYVVIVVVTWVLAATPAASPSLGRALLGAVLVSALAGAPGIAVGAGVLPRLWQRLPAWVRSTAYGALAGALLLVALAAATFATSLLAHLNEAATVVSGLHLGVGDALTLTLVTALLAPNGVLLATSYLVGPGFAVGTGTVVSPTVVSLGALPAFPALAAIPAEGEAPGWMVLFMALPALAGAVGAALAQRRSREVAYDLASLRGAGVGVGAGVVVAIGVALAGGPLGTGRMADIGAPFVEVLVITCGGMGVGGMLGGLASCAWQRWRREA